MNNTKAKNLTVGDDVYVYQQWFEITKITKCNFFPRALTFILNGDKEVSWMEEADIYKNK
jgi:hypothetical protein